MRKREKGKEHARKKKEQEEKRERRGKGKKGQCQSSGDSDQSVLSGGENAAQVPVDEGDNSDGSDTVCMICMICNARETPVSESMVFGWIVIFVVSGHTPTVLMGATRPPTHSFVLCAHPKIFSLAISSFYS